VRLTSPASPRPSPVTLERGRAPAARVGALASELAATGGSLTARDDRRALFFSLYAPCVRRIAEEMARGSFEAPDDVARVVLALGRRALEGLHASEGPWARAAALARSDASDARALGSAVNAHLSVDLPLSIAEAKVGRAFGPDLQRLGRLLVAESERMRVAPELGEARVVEAYETLPLVPALERALGSTAARDVAYSVLLHEATAQARLLGRVPAASGALRLVAGHRERVMDVWLRQAASARDRR
jgi:hypothetical protein